VLDGSRSDQGWQAYIPNDHNVMEKNPARGFVSSANQYPADSTYPYYITASHYEAYRNRRINDVLRKASNFTYRDMMRLQNDNYTREAAESLPPVLGCLDPARLGQVEKQACRTLRTGGYYSNPNSAGASYYEAWWD